MTFFLDIFGRPAPIGVRETLKVLDCSDKGWEPEHLAEAVRAQTAIARATGESE